MQMALGSLDGDVLTPVAIEGRNARFVPPDYLVHEVLSARSSGSMIAVTTIDPVSLEVEGSSTIVAPLVSQSGGLASYSVSQNGTIVYIQGHRNRPPVELDRNGRLISEPREEPVGAWAFDVGRETSSLVMAGETAGLLRYLDYEDQRLPELVHTEAHFPALGPGDTVVAFVSWDPSDTALNCPVLLANMNRGQLETLLTGRRPCLYPTDWSRDGREILLSDGIPWMDPGIEHASIWRYSVADGEVRAEVQEPRASARQGALSPDGGWIAYASDRVGGRYEVYLRQRGEATRPIPVSRDGGAWPRWREDGRELYFVSPGGEVYVTAVPLDSLPSLLFRIPGWGATNNFGEGVATLFDVSPDGSRFFVNHAATESRPLIVIQNFFEELKLRVRNE